MSSKLRADVAHVLTDASLHQVSPGDPKRRLCAHGRKRCTPRDDWDEFYASGLENLRHVPSEGVTYWDGDKLKEGPMR